MVFKDLSKEWKETICFYLGGWIVKARDVLREEHPAPCITELYDGDLHAKRALSLAYGTLGDLTSASLAVHAIGQGEAVQSRGSTCSSVWRASTSKSLSL